VGLIPEDWNAVSMDEITTHVGDGLHGTPVYSSSGAYFFINGNNLDNGKVVVTSATKSVDHSEFLKHRKPLNDRSILMSINGTVGSLGLFDGEQVVLGKSVAYLNVKPKISKQFVYHSLQTQIVKQQFLDGLTGSTISNLGLATIRQTLIPLPPIEAEQRAIAAALSDVDALLAKLDQLIAKKRDLKQATMQQLLTSQRRLPGFSGEWEVKRLGELFAFSGGHTASRDQLSDSGYCYLHYGDIHLSKKTFIDLDSEFQDIPKLQVRLSDVNTASLLKDGDVVFVDASEDDEGTSKHIVVVNPNDRPYISGLHTIVAKSKGNKIDNLFKRYCFQTRNIKEQFRFFAVGTKVSGISKTSVAKVELYFPPLLAEQTAIATVLSDMDAELAALEARRDKTRALKQGMMQTLLTGKIRLLADSNGACHDKVQTTTLDTTAGAP
jgi:type I restriction enzyme S subunit